MEKHSSCIGIECSLNSKEKNPIHPYSIDTRNEEGLFHLRRSRALRQNHSTILCWKFCFIASVLFQSVVLWQFYTFSMKYCYEFLLHFHWKLYGLYSFVFLKYDNTHNYLKRSFIILVILNFLSLLYI